MNKTERGLFIVHRTDAKAAQRNLDRLASRFLEVLVETEDPAKANAAITALLRLDDPGLKLIQGSAGVPGKTEGGAP